jgi:hypothetical protein
MSLSSVAGILDGYGGWHTVVAPRKSLRHHVRPGMPGRPGVARASRIRRPTKTLPLAPGPRKPGADAFLNHGALELSKYAHHLKHRLACRRRGVEPLLARE